LSRKKCIAVKKNIKNDLLRRAMIAFNCKKVNELAILLDVTPQNLNGYLDRGTFIKLIEGISYERGISIDWIITGQGSMHITGIKEAVAPYGVVALSNNTPAQSKPLLELTADVLSTDSVYRSALESNVKAFHDAVEARKQLAISEAKLAQCQQENIELKQRLNEKDSTIEKLESIISELRRGKSSVNGV
jgi:hypothetical protein